VKSRKEDDVFEGKKMKGMQSVSANRVEWILRQTKADKGYIVCEPDVIDWEAERWYATNEPRL